MLRNSEKLLKKSLAVLMLTSALCLASCGTTKTTTTARGQYERSSESIADSTGTETTATQTRIRAQVDSLFQAALKQTKDHESEASVEQTLHLLLFDTTQPADTATGLPPVLAALTQSTSTKRKETTRSTAQADVTAKLTSEQADSTQTVTERTAHVQAEQQTAETAHSYTTDEVRKQRGSWSGWALIALVLLLAASVGGFILYRKYKH